MGARGRRTRVVLVAAVAAFGCSEPTEPEQFESGTVEFDWADEGTQEMTLWTVEGSCGERGFQLGSVTCAVGSDEGNYWAVLGVRRNEGDTFDRVTVVHPPNEGTCEATYDGQGTTNCTVEFLQDLETFQQTPFPAYVMTSGTITITLTEDGEERLTGTFSGVAEDFSTLELAPITVINGTFDVDFVQ